MKSKRKLIEAVIFDFDGLILDTETTEFISWQEIYAEYGVEMPVEIWTNSIGIMEAIDPFALLQERTDKPLDRKSIHTKRFNREVDLLEKQPIMPGVVDMIGQGKALGLKVGIASSSDREWVTSNLERLGLLEQFKVICGRDNVGGKSKPAPDVYLETARRLGIDPGNSLALEDSANGCLAAKRAGMFCVAVPNKMTRGLDFNIADFRLESLAGESLPGLIDRLNSQ